ncbi:fimbrial protein [Enterobacter cloacae]|uniref:fimbrial protein n=1 Tax=Enterobacter quasihormaechei TaxID=2529382 RepID=UPI000C9CB12C|nr:fimbrial protein [Enterobacter cloacae]
MNFKKAMLSLVLISGFATSASSIAADGTITFKGTITSAACTVTDPSSSGTGGTVDFGVVSSDALKGAGTKAMPVGFNISLTDCPSTVSKASVVFDGTSDAVNSKLLALDNSSTAKGFGIALYDQNDSQIGVKEKSNAYTISTGDNNLAFNARLMSTSAAVTAGNFTSSADFTVNYQ